MSKSNSLEGDLLRKIFQAVALPWDAITAIFVSLHTADPLDAGTQASNEVVYTGYARVSVARTSGGWTVTVVDNGPSTTNPVANIDFPVATGGTANAAFFGVGTASSGAGTLLYSGTVTPPIAITTGVIPRLTTASVITED